jgi:DNA invertase Pin-like site-specific DNA recombinase
MMTFCRQQRREVKVVVVSDLSRLARSVADQAHTIADLTALGIRLCSIDEPHINNTAAGKLAANIHASFNQYFSDALSERTRERMQAAVKQGRFPWVAPLGYSNVKNGASNLSVDPARALLVRKAFELVGSGNYGPDEARRVVVALGLRTKNDKAVTKQTFSRRIRNELYMGWIVSGQLRAKSAHEALISEQLFHDVQDRLNGKRSVPHKRESEEFPLRGFVRCASCGKPLTAGWSRDRSQKYARYWCWTKDCGAVGIRRDKLEHHFTELLYLH